MPTTMKMLTSTQLSLLAPKDWGQISQLRLGLSEFPTYTNCTVPTVHLPRLLITDRACAYINAEWTLTNPSESILDSFPLVHTTLTASADIIRGEEIYTPMGWYGDHIWYLSDSDRLRLFRKYRTEINHTLPIALKWWAWNLVNSDPATMWELHDILHTHWKTAPRMLPPPMVIKAASAYLWWINCVFESQKLPSLPHTS